MATGQMSEVLLHVHRVVLLRDGAGLTDAQLLESFVTHRDGPALAALVRRHGPMVWGTVRRILADHQDAEDAFQATFLVLVRKAASITPREMVGNWLYGVAHQTALNARGAAARKRARERQVSAMPEPEAAQQELWDDLQPLLDQELSRLPDKYRAVLVLCDLEDRTRKEAARQLDLPDGTVASRLARARKMLAERLARRGLAVSAGALAAVVARESASASTPASVVASTIEVVSRLGAGQAATGLISVKVAALTEGVLRTMFMTKLKASLVVALAVVGALALGVGAFGASSPAEQVPPAALPPLPVAQLQEKEDDAPKKKAAKKAQSAKKAPRAKQADPVKQADPPRREKAEATVSKSFTTKKALRVVVETFNGPIHATTGAAGKTEVKVVKSVQAASQEDAEADLKNIDVQIKQEAGVVRVTARSTDQQRKTSRGAAVTLQVPPGAALELKTSNGAVTTRGATGNVTAVTSNGRIEARGSKGALSLKSSNGGITAEGGSGKLDLQTTNGGITIQATTATVTARTNNGAVRFKGSLAAGDQSFQTSNGSINVTLPAGASFRLDAQTSNGKVSCQFPLKGGAGKSKNRLQGTIGDKAKGTLKLRTSNGSISVGPETEGAEK